MKSAKVKGSINYFGILEARGWEKLQRIGDIWMEAYGVRRHLSRGTLIKEMLERSFRKGMAWAKAQDYRSL